MNFNGIISNLAPAAIILGIVFIILVAFVRKHQFSKAAREAIESQVSGCLVNAIVWEILAIAAILLSLQNVKLSNAYLQVVGANSVSAVLFPLSFVIVPMTFSVHKAYPRYDCRILAIVIFIVAAFVLGLCYYYF